MIVKEAAVELTRVTTGIVGRGTTTKGSDAVEPPLFTAFTITENTDISVIGDARNSC